MKARLLSNNLQIKVRLLFLLVALVPLGIMSIFPLKTAKKLIITMAASQLENVADDKAALLEKWILERKADLKVVAGSSILRSSDPEQIKPYLELVGRQYEVYKGFLVVDHNGSIIFNNCSKQPEFKSPEWYNLPIAAPLYISDVTFDPEYQDSFFHIAAPIIDDSGQSKGAICSMVSNHTILPTILRVSLGETGECYLVNKDGVFLAHKDPERIIAENTAQSKNLKNIFNSCPRQSAYIDYRGIEVLGTSRQIYGTNWRLVVEQDKDEAFLYAERLTKYVYLIIASSILATLFLAWLFSYYVVHPIQTLSKAISNLAKGKFEKAKVKTNRKDEIGVLYRAFEDMAKQLHARQHHLEQKVDLTEAELKETGEQLQRTHLAATRASQLAAVGQLAAGVTHEIRTPLTSLKLFLESYQSEAEFSDEYEEDLKIALNQVRRIEATVSRFLGLAKPKKPHLSIIGVNQLIEETLLIIRPKANQQKVSVEVSIDKDLPALEGDKNQLGEALLNLMINALEAMNNSGKLTITAASDQGEVEGVSGIYLQIDISDTGQGIDSENMSQLFEPFFTSKAAGTGLGLSIVYNTIQMHNGDIKVKSIIGKGTTFSIFLPPWQIQTTLVI